MIGRWSATLTLVAMLLGGTFACAADETTERVQATLARSLDWLEKHPTDPRTAVLGNSGLDAWSWHVFSTWHPDAAVRERAGEELDRRLRAVRAPSRWDAVALSYWAMLLRIGQLRGVELDSSAPIPAGPELRAELDRTDRATAFWIRQLLHHVGRSPEPELSATFIGKAPEDRLNYEPSVDDAYAMFHDLVAATGLGVAPFELSAERTRFLRDNLPRWMAASRRLGDTDAVAEVAVAAALLDERDATYHDAIAWLLSQQRPEGTYRSDRVGAGRVTVDDQRHAVLVCSFALLTSLERFEPVAGITPRERSQPPAEDAQSE